MGRFFFARKQCIDDKVESMVLEVEEYEAWTKFHKAPMYDTVIAKGCVIEFGKYPTFRGRIRVDPPLGSENK